MPLQLIFHLELGKPSTITAIWDIVEDRLRVTKITGGGRIVEELRRHATEAGLVPDSVGDGSRSHVDDDGSAWRQLDRYDVLGETFQQDLDAAFSSLFSHLRIEQTSTVGKHRTWSDFRLFLQKPDGTFTDAWVWKDDLTWIEART